VQACELVEVITLAGVPCGFSRFHELRQVHKSLTNMASSDESHLFELYKQVCISDETGQVAWSDLLRLQVEIASELKAHIEQLEGELNDEE
jgi:hypothetical protein